MRDQDERIYRTHFLLHAACSLITLPLLIICLRALALDMNFLPGGFSTETAATMMIYAMSTHLLVAAGAWKREPWIFEKSIVLGFALLFALPLGPLMGLVILKANWPRDRAIARRRPQIPLSEAWPESFDKTKERER